MNRFRHDRFRSGCGAGVFGGRGRTIKWMRRNVAATASILVILCGVVSFTISTMVNQARLQRERDNAENARRVAEVHSGDALLGEGEALAANHRLAQAKQSIGQALKLFLQTRSSTL